jgi:putative ABC transport system permease protein
VRRADVIGLSLSALWQQKVRVVLTTLGVMFGAFVLTASLSIRQGAQEALVRQYKRFGELRQIDVLPLRLARNAQPPLEKFQVKGNMSDAKRKRLEKELFMRWQRQAYTADEHAGLPQGLVAKIAALDHVRLVQPLVWTPGRVFLDGKNEGIMLLGIAPDDPAVQRRLVAGKMFPSADASSIVISEYTLYQLGLTDDEQISKLIGGKLLVEFRLGGVTRQFDLLQLLQLSGKGLSVAEEKTLDKIAKRLPEQILKLDLDAQEKELLKKLMAQPSKPKETPLIIQKEFTVCGVLAAGADVPRTSIWWWAYGGFDVALPLQTAEELYLNFPRYKTYGFERLLVEVDDVQNVKAVNDQIRAFGLETFTLVEALERERSVVLLISLCMTIVAVIALIVAALGIVNTMLMSVLERVREIGIMKAVGARELDLRQMFLVEGGLVGLIGGILGVLLGWVFSYPADAWITYEFARQIDIKLEQSVFAFPLWLVLGVPLFSCITTTLAAYYPARRAAKIDPIQALRHE